MSTEKETDESIIEVENKSILGTIFEKIPGIDTYDYG